MTSPSAAPPWAPRPAWHLQRICASAPNRSHQRHRPRADMLFWIVDHAGIFYWLLSFVALGFIATWYWTKRAKFLGYGGAVVGVGALLFLLTRIVVSDRQQIQNNI